MVRQGDFDRVLLRPRSTVVQVACQDLSLSIWPVRAGADRAPLGGGAVGGRVDAGESRAGRRWNRRGVCIFAGLFVLQATMCFWTIESLEMMNILTYGGVEAAQYPLAIYSPVAAKVVHLDRAAGVHQLCAVGRDIRRPGRWSTAVELDQPAWRGRVLRRMPAGMEVWRAALLLDGQLRRNV